MSSPVIAPADTVLKPDFAAPRNHFVFGEEDERLRESIHRFVVAERRPAATRWMLDLIRRSYGL